MTVLEQEAPLRALFPAVEPGEAPEAAIVNTGGGMVGGDRFQVGVTLGEGAALTVTTPAAEKIYRSLGPDCRVLTRLSGGSGAMLEWLPQETILFDGACLERRLHIDLDVSTRFLGVEIVLFGRQARGESLSRGRLHDSWAVRIGGRAAWMDAVGLSGDLAAARARPFGFGDSAGYATVAVAGPDASSLLPEAREIAAACGSEGGATLVNGILLLRFLDADSARLRASAAASVAALRPLVTGGRAALPRLWMN